MECGYGHVCQFCTRMLSGTSLLKGTPRKWPDIFGDCVNRCTELNVFGVEIAGVFVLQMCVCVCVCAYLDVGYRQGEGGLMARACYETYTVMSAVRTD